MPAKPKKITPPPVYVAPSKGRGRGVFAARPIRKGEVIERCPVVVVPRGFWGRLKKTPIGDYVFDWGRDHEDIAMVLGYGMLYNHSSTPNVTFHTKLSEKVYEFVALRDIKKGEEICSNYNGDPDDPTPLWFQERARHKRR